MKYCEESRNISLDNKQIANYNQKLFIYSISYSSFALLKLL